MIRRSLADIARVTGGELHGVDAAGAASLEVTGPVVTDSREAGPGSLYVARVGERMDGHDFVADAAGRGAVAVLASRPVGELPGVVVPDVQAGFVALARDLVDGLPGLTVVGVTGSSGKTSTKDLLASVLAATGETVATAGSLNSEVGVPLTVCRVTDDTAFLVVEMGARGVGHIRYLTEIVPPRVGVVLNVGVAHLGEFGSREAIGRAKAELVEALPADGTAVLNADDSVVAAMAARTRARVVTVGRATGADGAGRRADLRAEDVVLDGAARPSFVLVHAGARVPVTLAMHGEHHVDNALAVAAVGLACGMGLEQVGEALAAARPASRWRMEVTERPDGVTVVNDAYNANPDSTRAALRALAGMSAGRRSFAVLGSMLELGAESDAEHAGVGRDAVEHGTDRVVVVGDVARPVLDGALAAGADTGRVSWVPDVEAAHELLAAELAPGDVVLLKSSRDAGLRLLGERLSGQMEDPS